MIKAVFFDIDGTILSHKQHDVPQSTRRAMAVLREKGIACVIASGRHMTEIWRLPVSELPFDGYVTLNGQICCDREGASFFGQPFTGEDLRPMLRMFQEREFSVMLVGRESMYANYVSEDMKRAHEALSIPLPRLGEYGGEQLYQVIVYADEAAAQKFLPDMPPCHLTRWNPYGIDMVPMAGGKVTGIREMLTHLGLGREEIMAFGDGDNDMEMLEFAGIGVAMGNATEHVKAKADFITRDIEEDGVEFALRHFGLV